MERKELCKCGKPLPMEDGLVVFSTCDECCLKDVEEEEKYCLWCGEELEKEHYGEPFCSPEHGRAYYEEEYRERRDNDGLL